MIHANEQAGEQSGQRRTPPVFFLKDEPDSTQQSWQVTHGLHFGIVSHYGYNGTISSISIRKASQDTQPGFDTQYL